MTFVEPNFYNATLAYREWLLAKLKLSQGPNHRFAAGSSVRSVGGVGLLGDELNEERDS
jgi:hypothetical protein